MELTITVDKNVAEKLKMISKLGGLNSEDLNKDLSEAVGKHLSHHLIILTRKMLASVGVHDELTTPSCDMGASTETFLTTEELGSDLESFDAINTTSAGNLLDPEPEPIMPESAEDKVDTELTFEADDDIQQEEAQEETQEEISWQDSMNTDEFEDPYLEEFSFEDSPSKRLAPTVSVINNDSPTGLESIDPRDSSTKLILPGDMGISCGVSMDSGSSKGGAEFLAALLTSDDSQGF